jgi:hypothetical protein
MRLRNTFVLQMLACLAVVCAPVFATGEAADDASMPQLEIKQYRFSRHATGFDRLVLEFTRKDSNTSKPAVHAERGATGEWTISVDNTVLLGGIPEVLINDSFKKKSRFLGDVSVNMDSARGFSIHANLKKNRGNHVESFWLDAPSRLVIDSYGSAPAAQAAPVAHEKRETASVATDTKLEIERKAQIKGFGHLVCFPATARVGLTVVFQPNGAEADQLQNFRINTDGIGGTNSPPPDAINCYPKTSQIKAELSYEDGKSGGYPMPGKSPFAGLPASYSGTVGAVTPLAPITPSPLQNLAPITPGTLPGLAPLRPMGLPPMGAASQPSSPLTALGSLPGLNAPKAPMVNPLAAQAPKGLPMPGSLTSLMGKAPLSPLPAAAPGIPTPPGITPAPPLRASGNLGLPSPSANVGSDLDLDPGPLDAPRVPATDSK